MLASASDHHIFDKIRFSSKTEAAQRYLEPIITAYQNGITPRVHLEDCTRADIHGWVIPFMQLVLEKTNGTAKFRVCDTIGWGSPDPYAALPWGIPRLIATLRRETGAELEFHGHNDFGLATANGLAAWRYGCAKVNTTVGGLGERTGNTSLEQMVANYVRCYGNPGLKLDLLTEIASFITREVSEISDRAPIVGDVFSTQAGIHQAGVNRQADAPGGLIYLPYEPARVGRGHVELNLIGAMSGTDGIASVINQALGLQPGEPGSVTGSDRAVKEVYDAIQRAYDGRYDPNTGKYLDERREFFAPDEVLRLAHEAGLQTPGHVPAVAGQ